MRIQHNIAALNSHRQLGGNNNAVSKNLEKLSSGYRINRAGDDAAGLAISEKMRAQITGLETAQKNANDGISLVQTAEGALTEVHSMLNRMVELAGQSANGTYQDKVDRDNLQKELDSLTKEIDRISTGTNFNGIKLLDGSMGGAQVSSTPGAAAVTGTPGAAATKTTFEVDFGTEITGALAAGGSLAVGDVTVPGHVTNTDTAAKVVSELKGAITANSNKVTLDSVVYDVTWDATNQKATFTAAAAGATTSTGASVAAGITNAGTAFTAADITGFTAGAAAGPNAGASTATAATTTLSFNGNPKAGDLLEIDGEKFQFVKTAGDKTDTGYTAIVIGTDSKGTATAVRAALTAVPTKFASIGGTGTDVTFGKLSTDPNVHVPSIVTQKSQGLTLQIGESAEAFNQLSVAVQSMSSASLGIGANDIDVSTQDTAKLTIEKIKTAINTVSSTRGDLGAIQNRLEHTINNLGVTSENMTAAESRIRDVDMAQEMMAFTKNNILTQASQSMLAQANQLPQGVLQLLQ